MTAFARPITHGHAPSAVLPIGDDQASALRRLVEAMNPAAATTPPQHPPRSSSLGNLPLVGAAPARAPVISIASGKGGVGKTTIAVNLCVALASRGIRTTLLDGDLGLANADLLCGLTPRGDLTDVLEGRKRIEEIIATAPGGFRLIPGAAGVASVADAGPDALARIGHALDEISVASDLIVVDCGAGIGRGVLSLFGAGDLRLIVATPEPTSLADAYALLKRSRAPDMRADGAVRTMLMVNEAADEREARSVAARLSAVAQRFLGEGVPMAGWAPLDPRVGEAVRHRRPLLMTHPTSAAGRQLTQLSAFVRKELGIGSTSSAAAQVAESFVSPWWTRLRAIAAVAR